MSLGHLCPSVDPSRPPSIFLFYKKTGLELLTNNITKFIEEFKLHKTASLLKFTHINTIKNLSCSGWSYFSDSYDPTAYVINEWHLYRWQLQPTAIVLSRIQRLLCLNPLSKLLHPCKHLRLHFWLSTWAHWFNDVRRDDFTDQIRNIVKFRQCIDNMHHHKSWYE